jgi:hypothetical protein
VGAVLAAVLAAGHAADAEPLYVKQATLQATMLATRAQLAGWAAAQREARQAITIGPWRRTAQRDAAPAAGKACAADASGNPQLDRAATGSLRTTITAQRPVVLTLELSRHERFGGYAYRPPSCGAGVKSTDTLVWLNGRQLPLVDRLDGYRRVPMAKRRGWHDALLVDVPLVAGENRLAVTLDKRGQRGWFTAVRVQSQPGPALWAMIEQDFPRATNRLLEAVDAAWFEPGGWFDTPASTRWEQAFLQSVEASLGADGALLVAARGKLTSADASDPRWLELCVAAAESQAVLRQADAVREAIEALRPADPVHYPADRLRARVAELRGQVLAQCIPPSGQLRDALCAVQREALVTRNPLLDGKQLLFVKRATYDSNHYYDEYNVGLRRFGGGLYRLTLADGTVHEIAPALHQGLIDRYDLSFDARRVLFNYKPPRPEGFRLWEMGIDGRGLRQITFPPSDEAARIATYATCTKEERQQDPTRYGHWTDDMHPCYLPDGRIVFTSTRSERSVLCGGHSLTVTNLYCVDADGQGLVQLSQGALSEFCPTVMNDGRILYNRWEYVDKGAGAVQSLWAMFPDGGQSEEIYGNNIPRPAVFNQARHVPGRDNLIVCLGSGHSPANAGAILLVDRHKNKRSPEAMTVLTPGSLPEGNWGLRQVRNGRTVVDIYGPWYCDPFPLGDAQSPAAGKFFLVSCNPTGMWNDPAGYGIYLLDVYGNRVPIYADAEFSCFQARPLEARPRPPRLGPSTVATDEPAADEATLLVTDVYQGMEGVRRGAVKYLRVMEQVPRPWAVYQGYQKNDAAPGQMAAVSLYTHLSVKVLHGVVPVAEDGSACFKVPARRSVFLQALDGDFMEIQRMRTFVNFQPGERRACIGCHEHRHQAPQGRMLEALRDAPLHPEPQPGDRGPRPLHYATDIQPIFDRNCIGCHNAKKRENDLDLTGTLTPLFSVSYESIIHKDLVGYIQEFVGPKPAGADAMGYAPAVPPYTYGSHRAKLIEVLRAGHNGVTLTREEFVRLVTWVDANTPYYGSYFGRRNIAYRDRPDFRPVPTLQSALGVRPTWPAAQP